MPNVNFNELPEDLLGIITDHYMYNLRFRMCMREINKISQWVEYQEGPGFGHIDAIHKWGRSTVYVKGPGFALHMGHTLYRCIAAFGARGWRKPYDDEDLCGFVWPHTNAL